MYIMPNYISNFKATDYRTRLQSAQLALHEHPDKCSVIVGRAEGSDVPDVDKHKYLVRRDLTVGQFVYVIRKRLELPPEKALFLFCNKILPVASWTMGDLYNKHKDHDEFLYISYASENTFGNYLALC